MEIRPEILEKILDRSDEHLWEMIRKLGVMNGLSLPATPPSHAQMEQLRTHLRSGDFDYAQAERIVENAKKQERKP